MSKLSLKAAKVLFVALVFVFGMGSTALAVSWSDVDSAVLDSYGVSLAQLARVSSGFPDGTWQPWRSITRAQFVKMAVTAFAIDLADPATPTFTDVAPTDRFYQYVEGACQAGLIKGTGGGLFEPASTITREQVIAIIARKVAGDQDYDLSAMTEEEIAAALQDFGDAASISAGLRAEMAFAVTQGLIKGDASGRLDPQAATSRIGAAVLLIRAVGAGQLKLDTEDNGTSITVKVGDLIEVVLKGNPTTGFGWTADLSEEDAGILQQVGEPAYVPDSNLIGAGGTYTFTFKALKAGEAVLKLVYERSWEDVPPAETFSVTVKVEESPLDGTAWKLEGWSVNSLYPGDFEITASFDDGRISGKSAVNTYSGPYTTGANGRFSVGVLVSTLMAGSDEAMRAERIYFDLLEQTRLYRLTKGGLTLLDGRGNELLIFAPAS